MFAVEKNIENKEVIVLEDYYGNGRLVIDGVAVATYDSDYGQNKRLLSYGWTKSFSKNARISTGIFKGQPHMVDWFEFNERYWNNTLDLTQKLSKVEKQISNFIKTGLWE